MKRIVKERDRLLRRLCRITGLTSCTAAGVCLLVPHRTSGVATLIGLIALIGLAGLIELHSRRGALTAALGAVLLGMLFAVIVDVDPGADPASLTAVGIVAGAAVASVSLTLVVRPYGAAVVGACTFAMLVVVCTAAAAGAQVFPLVLAVLAGWIALATLAGWIASGVSRAAERIAEVGRAHEAERLASEAESQQRQDARVLHDTVLATLSLLAHSGVGVGEQALRQQAGDDARLLRQLRLGAPLVGGSSAIFSPESGEDELGATFESVRQRFARMGLDVNWHGAGQLVLPRERLDALLGAVGECLENVRRHSGVNEADVTVTDDDRTVRAMVTDAGVGFDPSGVDGARLGFAESVVGRLQSVGGRARVFSSPGAGTTVMLEVPKP